MRSPFHDHFVELFNGHYHRLHRYLSRLSGDPELAADLAQEAFVRLYQRWSLPERPEAWLITVATNLFRNVRTKESRRLRLLTPGRGEDSLADPPSSPADAVDAGETRKWVRTALDRMSERDRCMLLLRAEGCAYREIAAALGIHETSVGTLLARAKRSFRAIYEDMDDASG